MPTRLCHLKPSTHHQNVDWNAFVHHLEGRSYRALFAHSHGWSSDRIEVNVVARLTSSNRRRSPGTAPLRTMSIRILARLITHNALRLYLEPCSSQREPSSPQKQEISTTSLESTPKSRSKLGNRLSTRFTRPEATSTSSCGLSVARQSLKFFPKRLVFL